MVDYSKFDKIELSDDEMDDGEIPRFTKFDKPTSVTIQGVKKNEKTPSKTITNSVSNQYQAWKDWEKKQNGEEEEEEEENVNVEEEPHSTKSMDKEEAAKDIVLPTQMKIKQKNYTENGADVGLFFWTQTADEVWLRVRCESEIKARDVQVLLSKLNELRVIVKGKEILIGKLVNDVWGGQEKGSLTVNEEEKFHKSFEWEMEDVEKQRCIMIHFHKRPPHELVKIWWKRMFENSINELDIDLSNVSARKTKEIEATQKAWKEAHEIFIANRKKEKEAHD